MPYCNERERQKRPKDRFAQQREASPTSRVRKTSPLRRPAGATPLSSPRSKRQYLLQLAAQRIGSFSAPKVKTSRLPIYSPKSTRSGREVLNPQDLNPSLSKSLYSLLSCFRARFSDTATSLNLSKRHHWTRLQTNHFQAYRLPHVLVKSHFSADLC